MKRYDYTEAMKADIREYINDNIDASDFADRDELEQQLNEDLWIDDGVTGNASGSYTFNRVLAQEYVSNNMDLLQAMCSEFCIEAAEIGAHFLNSDWEWMDVSIRCYLLGGCVAEVLDELDNDLVYAEV